MAVPTKEVMIEGLPGWRDSWLYELWVRPTMPDFWPMPGERRIETNAIWLDPDIIHDGSGPALAAYQYGLCPFA